MQKDDFFSNLEIVSKSISLAFGERCEVSVCDISTGSLVILENPQVTGRTVGSKIDPQTLRLFVNNKEMYRQPVLYPSHSQITGKPLVCCTSILSEGNTPRALFTINICTEPSVSSPIIAEHETSATPEFPAYTTTSKKSGMDVEEYTKKLIHDILIGSNSMFGKPLELSSKESKLGILKELDDRGVLNVRDMVPYVCNILAISQATFYNYLKEIHNQ